MALYTCIFAQLCAPFCVCMCVCVVRACVRAYVRLCGLHHCCYDFTIQQKILIVVVVNCCASF